jgi:hypothetical protein
MQNPFIINNLYITSISILFKDNTRDEIAQKRA